MPDITFLYNEYVLMVNRRVLLRGAIALIFKRLYERNRIYSRDRKTTRTYECGYSPFASRLKPNVRNYIPVRLLFLLFDLEFLFLVPYFLNPTHVHFERHLCIQGFLILLRINYRLEIKCKIFKKK
jgi:NADH:ubiquinone oxidoreductase subunit 3 (subunit A)